VIATQCELWPKVQILAIKTAKCAPILYTNFLLMYYMADFLLFGNDSC
jgi:hypothetical protein